MSEVQRDLAHLLAVVKTNPITTLVVLAFVIVDGVMVLDLLGRLF